VTSEASYISPEKSQTEMSMDWIHPWIGLDWIGLGPMTVVYKILTVYVFQGNRPGLFYVA